MIFSPFLSDFCEDSNFSLPDFSRIQVVLFVEATKCKKHNCDSLLFSGQYDGFRYWQNKKNRSGTKNPDRNLPDFFNRQMAFNQLHLNHLQQVRCCCWCKVKNSESKSQRSKMPYKWPQYSIRTTSWGMPFAFVGDFLRQI